VKLTKSKLKQLIKEELTKGEEKKKDKLEKDLEKLKHK